MNFLQLNNIVPWRGGVREVVVCRVLLIHTGIPLGWPIIKFTLATVLIQTPILLWYIPGWWYKTHRYGGGSWASSQGRLWPFLGKDGRCTEFYRGGNWASPRVGCDQSCRYREVGRSLMVGCDQSWASLGPPLTYMYIPGVQNAESMGAKVRREEHLIPIPTFIEKHNCLQSRSPG